MTQSSTGSQTRYLIDLTVRLTAAPGAKEYEFRLVADGGTPGAASTVLDPVAALAAVERFGEDIFFPKPGPAKLCTQQYGGPQMAVVTGQFKGRAVQSYFKRTDGCEIARWRALAPLFGAPAGSSGRI